MRNSIFNQSGCKYETAFKAIAAVSKEEADAHRRIGKAMAIIKLVLDLAGLKQKNRIEIIDVKSGKEFK